MQKALLIISLFALASCGKTYRSISEFNIQPTALKNGDRIKLLFAMVGSTNNQEDQYYNHLIAVSQETGDTVNILVPFNHGLTETDADKIFNYFGPESQNAKLLSTDPEKLASLKNIGSITAEFPKYSKVAYDSKYDDWIKNDLPTVVGIIGTEK
jgi:hypothetical protein